MTHMHLLLGLFFLTIALSWDPAAAQVEFQGNNYLEYAVDRQTDNRYFENWTDAFLSSGNWRLGIRYEFHLPPQPF